ncbi:flippase-like domain-containing protein [Micromonospora sp. HM134]|uniref:lysylphosphatidylglycerol synthase domain-containing protein n=1 Tax=Micromonospora sp. HM134 TaxID=2583243 RepID=UPI0011983679|nr:lysylphosphatidylglycerol synthase domain-containing protein [Micromonospora sp. HM134]QDY08429.1 flippase-like domain-containing protein [Micromonospora sp. HM134]
MSSDATGTSPARARTAWAWVSNLGGVALVGALLWWLGTGPALAGLRRIDAPTVLGALALGALAAVGCAWRWRLVAEALGVRLPLGAAVADCYRAVFLNATLPGGVLGDVHRAVRHGREAGDLGRAVRAVVWERTAGQLVQVVLAVALLLALPSPVRPYLPTVTAVAVAVGLALVVLVRALPRSGPSRQARAVRAAVEDVRAGLLGRRTGPGVLLTSTVVVGCHLATFVLAARVAGVTAPLAVLVPLTLLALLAMGLPANMAGFGPREGVAAWAFGAAGLGAAEGVATALVYGALVLVAALPGAAVLVLRGRPSALRGRPGDRTVGSQGGSSPVPAAGLAGSA